mmetsp:Transcript_8373/g.25130  ORF Transcript_8373/g.25130 Transcript_8373/m.25130 type:complete len:224 (+) Transcript_8373:1485-2156(+)
MTRGSSSTVSPGILASRAGTGRLFATPRVGGLFATRPGVDVSSVLSVPASCTPDLPRYLNVRLGTELLGGRGPSPPSMKGVRLRFLAPRSFQYAACSVLSACRPSSMSTTMSARAAAASCRPGNASSPKRSDSHIHREATWYESSMSFSSSAEHGVSCGYLTLKGAGCCLEYLKDHSFIEPMAFWLRVLQGDMANLKRSANDKLFTCSSMRASSSRLSCWQKK